MSLGVMSVATKPHFTLEAGELDIQLKPDSKAALFSVPQPAPGFFFFFVSFLFLVSQFQYLKVLVVFFAGLICWHPGSSFFFRFPVEVPPFA